MKKRLISTVVWLFVAAALFLMSVNGIKPHPYEKEQLQNVFLEKVADNGLSLQEGYEVIEQEHANSMTFLFKDVNGKYAWGTYVCSPMTERYKLFDFYLGNEKTGQFTYVVNDGMMRYDMTVGFGDVLTITGSQNMYSVLTIKMLTLSFAIMVIMANLLLNTVNKKDGNER